MGVLDSGAWSTNRVVWRFVWHPVRALIGAPSVRLPTYLTSSPPTRPGTYWPRGAERGARRRCTVGGGVLLVRRSFRSCCADLVQAAIR